MWLKHPNVNTKATANYRQCIMKLVSYTRCRIAYFKMKLPYPSYFSHLLLSKLCRASPENAHDGIRLVIAMARF